MRHLWGAFDVIRDGIRVAAPPFPLTPSDSSDKKNGFPDGGRAHRVREDTGGGRGWGGRCRGSGGGRPAASGARGPQPRAPRAEATGPPVPRVRGADSGFSGRMFVRRAPELFMAMPPPPKSAILAFARLVVGGAGMLSRRKPLAVGVCGGSPPISSSSPPYIYPRLIYLVTQPHMAKINPRIP